jgi:hypothetical protein
MKRQISSSFTFFQKFIVSGFFMSASFVMFYLIVLPFLERDALRLEVVIFVIVWGALVTHICFKVLIPLKRISIDKEYMYISNYLSIIRVPFFEIADIKQTHEFKFKIIVITLKVDTKFGKVIKFIPRSNSAWSRGGSSIIEEINKLIPNT